MVFIIPNHLLVLLDQLMLEHIHFIGIVFVGGLRAAFTIYSLCFILIGRW